MSAVPERAKNDFQQTQRDIDSLLQSIKGRWQQREKGDASKGESEQPAKTLALAKEPKWKDTSIQDDFHAKSKPQQWEIHLEEVLGDSERKANLMQKVPLTKSKDGEICVDMKRLWSGTSGMLRGMGDRRPLTSHDIEAASKIRKGRLQRSTSAPNFLRMNASSSSLKCLRPDNRRREQAKQVHRRSQRCSQVQKHREAEDIWHRTNAEQRKRASVIENLNRELTPERFASQRRASEMVFESAFARKRGSLLSKAASLIEVEAREIFRWLAAESFLISVFGVKRCIRAQALWTHVVERVRVIRIVSRWRRKARARHLLRAVLAVISPSFRLLVRHRKKRFASQRIQRVWRSFSLRMGMYVDKLINQHWRKHESTLLEGIFNDCPTDGDVVIGHRCDEDPGDRALLVLYDGGEEEEGLTCSETISPYRSDNASEPRKKYSNEQPTILEEVVIQKITSLASGPSRLTRPHSAELARSNSIKYSSQDDSADRIIQSEMQRAGEILNSAISGNLKEAQVAATSPFVLNSDSSLAGVPMWSKLRKATKKNHLTGIEAVVSQMTKSGRRLQDQMYNQILEEAIRRRRRHQVEQHCFRREVVRVILRRDIVERLYDKVRQTRGAKSRISMVCDALDLSIAPVPVTVRPTTEEIAEIVLCAHYGHGARPAREDIAFTYFKNCPCWRIVAVTGLLDGTRSIKDGLMDRWGARRGHQKETIRHFRRRAQALHGHLTFLEFVDELQQSSPIVSDSTKQNKQKSSSTAPHHRSRPASAPAAPSTSASRVAEKMNDTNLDDTLDSNDARPSTIQRTLSDVEIFRHDERHEDVEGTDNGDCHELPSKESGLRRLLPPVGFNSETSEGFGSVEMQNDFKSPRILQGLHLSEKKRATAQKFQSNKWRP